MVFVINYFVQHILMVAGDETAALSGRNKAFSTLTTSRIANKHRNLKYRAIVTDYLTVVKRSNLDGVLQFEDKLQIFDLSASANRYSPMQSVSRLSRSRSALAAFTTFMVASLQYFSNHIKCYLTKGVSMYYYI